MTDPDPTVYRATVLDLLIARLLEYADALEAAPVHDDMGLSMTHTQTADVLREAAAYLKNRP